MGNLATSLDAVFLARLQFAFTVGFHIVLPAFSIGLASYLAVLEGLWLRTKQQVYLDLFQFWVKGFSLVFGMGVVSGLVMSYEFGTNWSQFAKLAGPVVGPLMGYEVLTAFFLEAGFLGIMLFGMKRVGKGLHFFATCVVAFGTLLSAFWILSVNSWMQTPRGYTMSPDGRFLPASWMEIIFNPSFPVRLPHMVLASYLSVAFFVGAIGAWHLLRNRRDQAAQTMFSMAMWMAVLVAPLQIVMGDLHGLNTLKYQPAKIAAMEGDWETTNGAPLILFGMPNMDTEHTDYEVSIPHLGSLILTHEWNGEVPGLKSIPKENRPYSPVVFWSFRLMVGLGFAMLGVGALALLQRFRGRLYDTRWLHWMAAPRNRQAQAVALGRLAGRAVERFAELAQVFGVNALAMVAHADQNALALALGLQFNRLAWRVETLGVAQQVIHCAFDHGRPALKVQLVVSRQLHRLVRGTELGVLLQGFEQWVEVHLFRTGVVGIDAGQYQNFADQRFQAVAFAGQARPELFPFFGAGAFGQGQGDAQAGQWRAQFVGHVPQQLALAADQALQARAHAVEVSGQHAELIAPVSQLRQAVLLVGGLAKVMHRAAQSAERAGNGQRHQQTEQCQHHQRNRQRAQGPGQAAAVPFVEFRVRNAVDQQVGVAGFFTGVLGGQPAPGQVAVLAVILPSFEGGGALREGATHYRLAAFIQHLHVDVILALALLQ